MKTESQIATRLQCLLTNIKSIKNEQGAEVTKNYINALKWVLSNKEDRQEELNRRVE